MLFGMAANLGKLKTELREAEDNLVKALAEEIHIWRSLFIILCHLLGLGATSKIFVPLHMWKWKFEKTSTHLQRMKKVSLTVKSPTLPCQMKEHGMSLDNPGSSLGTFQPPDGITSAIFLSEIDNETIIVATAETKSYEKLSYRIFEMLPF